MKLRMCRAVKLPFVLAVYLAVPFAAPAALSAQETNEEVGHKPKVESPETAGQQSSERAGRPAASTRSRR